MAYRFWVPGMMKWNNMDNIVEWFGSLGIPFPAVNAYLSATTEVSGAVLLLMGMGTRIVALPLIVVMLVAIFTVHIGNGFEAGNNGFEIPLYYIIMLIMLLTYGGGKIIIDYLFKRATLA